MTKSIHLTFFLLLVAVHVSEGCGGVEKEKKLCLQGEEEECKCSNDQWGIRSCGPDGTWDDCVCHSAQPGGKPDDNINYDTDKDGDSEYEFDLDGSMDSGSDYPADASPDSTEDKCSYGPLAGGVTCTGARLWMRTEEPADVSFRYSEHEDFHLSYLTPSQQTSEDSDYTVVAKLSELKPDTIYYYTPRVNSEDIFRQNRPYFRTAPEPGRRSDFTFVILTDFQNALSPGTVQTYRSAHGANPAFAIIGGDMDHRNPGKHQKDLDYILFLTREMLRQNIDRNNERRRDFVDFILRKSSIAHQWDDHDFCCNDSDGTYIGKEMALKAYDEYFPSYDRPYPEKGIFQTWRWGHVHFILLDGRYNRTPSDQTDDEHKTMLGGLQKEWLKQELRHSDAVWKIILSGSVFNPTVKCGADNWCEYRTEGKELTDFINNQGIKNVVIISGDIHAGAITDGTNSVYNTFWEMALPGADVIVPGCDTTTYRGRDKFGEWTHGTWGAGYRLMNPVKTCFGYGQVDVLTNPHRLVLSVRNEFGEVMLSAEVHADTARRRGVWHPN